MRAATHSLADYRRAELRHAPYRIALYTTIAGLALIGRVLRNPAMSYDQQEVEIANALHESRVVNIPFIEANIPDISDG